MFVALGGALGSTARYLVSLAYLRVFGPAVVSGLPLGTFTVNVVGSFALGWLSHWGAGRMLLGVDVRLLLGTGVLGGFTTYSSFNQETLRMLHGGDSFRAVLYAIGTLLVCLLAGAAGMWLSLRAAA